MKLIISQADPIGSPNIKGVAFDFLQQLVSQRNVQVEVVTNQGATVKGELDGWQKAGSNPPAIYVSGLEVRLALIATVTVK